MGMLVKIATLCIILIMLLFGFSLVPMQFVPGKIVEISNIKPISISEYGYINLLKWQYFVKDFSYITRVDDKSYLLLKADKLGSNMLRSKSDISIYGCKIYLLTANKSDDIVDVVLNYINKNIKYFNISGNHCEININKISDSDVTNIKNNENINEDDIMDILPDITLYANNVDFGFIKSEFTNEYKIKGIINDVNFELQASKDSIRDVIFAKFDTDEFEYKIEDLTSSIALKSKNIGKLIQNTFCTSSSCKDIFSGINSEIDINVKLSDKKWSGVINGLLRGSLQIDDKNTINVNLDKVNIPSKSIKNANDIKNYPSLSIYKLFSKYFVNDYSLLLKINEANIDDIKLNNINFNYDQIKKTINIDAKFNKDGEIITTLGDIKNPKFKIINITLKDFIDILNPKFKELLLPESCSLMGNADIEIQSGDISNYISRMTYNIQNSGSIEISSDECILDCTKNIILKDFDLWGVINRIKLLAFIGINKFITTPSNDIKQTALLYIQDTDVASKDFLNTFNISMKNINFNHDIINNLDINYQNSKAHKAVSVKNIDSNFAIGSLNFEANLSKNSISNVDIIMNFNTLKLEKIANILYPDVRSSDVTFVQPSLAGFDGHIDVNILDTGTFISNINISGNIKNGNIDSEGNSVNYNNFPVLFNLSSSLTAKPLIKVGIAINKINIADFLNLKDRLAIDGILNLSGNVSMSGFSVNQIKKSISANLSGAIYNYSIQKCNLQKLSDRLLNLKTINSLAVEDTIKSGFIIFPKADLQIRIDKNLLSCDISNAKTTGVSMSGMCTFNLEDHDITNCNAIFNIIGRDLNIIENFYNLQISFASGGILESPNYKFNLDQINQYKRNAMKIS